MVVLAVMAAWLSVVRVDGDDKEVVLMLVRLPVLSASLNSSIACEVQIRVDA